MNIHASFNTSMCTKCVIYEVLCVLNLENYIPDSGPSGYIYIYATAGVCKDVQRTADKQSSFNARLIMSLLGSWEPRTCGSYP